MSRPLRFIPGKKTLVEVTTRTVHSRLLLRPSHRTAFLPHLTPEILSDLGALNRVFWAWLEAEYHQTPHGGLAGQTPLDRFLDDQAWIREMLSVAQMTCRWWVRKVAPLSQ